MPTTRSSSASASMLSSPFKAVTLDSSPLVSPSTISKPPVTPKRVFKAVSAQTESENGVLASTRTPRTPKTPKGKSSLTEPLDTPSPSKKRKTAAPLFPPRNLIPNPGSSLIPAKLGFSLLQAKSHTISCDPRFSRVFEKIPCRPFEDLQPVDAFRALCTSIIGQQVSWLAARAINHRFRRLFFPNLPEKAVEKGSEMWTKDSDYPTPEQVLSKSVEELRSVGFSGRKVEYVQSLAQHFLDGRLSASFLQTAPVEEVSQALLDVRGIGQWTVDMFLIFTLRRPDIMPVGDLGIQKGLLRWILSAYANDPMPMPMPIPREGDVDRENSDGDRNVPELPPPEDQSSTIPGAATPDATAIVFPHSPPTPTSSTPTLSSTSDKDSGNVNGNGTDHTTTNTINTNNNNTKDEEGKAAVEASLHLCPPDFNPEVAYPLPQGLSLDVLKSRMAGKKVKGGAYLSPQEMYDLTDHWKPFRSLPVYYMWAVAEETS